MLALGVMFNVECLKFNAMENDKEIIIKKYLRDYEPVAHSGEPRVACGEANPLGTSATPPIHCAAEGEFIERVVVKTTEDIIRELEDIVEIETNDVVAVMLAEGYDLMRRNDVFGWAMRYRVER